MDWAISFSWWGKNIEQGIAIQTRTLGADHPRLATAHQTLGELQRRAGHFEEARGALNRAVAIQRSAAAGLDPEADCWILGSSAHLELDTGNYTEAETLFERTIACREELIGPSHLELAETLEGQARLLRIMHRDAEAETAEQRALGIRSKRAEGSSTASPR